MTKPKIYVDGEHGTTGLQILDRLNGREDIQLLSMPHEDRRNPDVRKALLNEADFAVLCLPDDASREAAVMVADGDTRLIDASTAHRTDPNWTFGFKELNPGHDQVIAASRFVSNPGCYSTGAIALIRPLTKSGLLSKDALITINAGSGYTGGGKGLIAQMEDDTREDAISAPHFIYALGLTHKHVPEITTYGMLTHAPIFARHDRPGAAAHCVPEQRQQGSRACGAGRPLRRIGPRSGGVTGRERRDCASRCDHLGRPGYNGSACLWP